MTTALYRRYRPESFAELIGQSQVTDPLRSALRADRVNHAYLFSGPRGCGKTTSARILARCLNCKEGPTDTPCGKCDSCIELSRGGPGSLDVVEIDAASHNGVDDARDLRERAIFAPARDRYKIFILDEAHMVTPQGFNALLKIVEEPPEHVKFIFATTEPEKVIGTIRSRTHHYPFRLVPPGELLEYLGTVLTAEGFSAEAGVMPLVVRASGGSVRDALSLLDQLIAGSDTKEVAYQRAVNLLGFTHDELMSEVIDAFAEIDAAKAFSAVDKVIQSGQDARRFLEDLLERIRDLMLVSSLGNDAKAILRGIGPEQFDILTIQANRFGLSDLTAAAEATSKALSDTSAASNPRLQLELLCARVLAPVSQRSIASIHQEPVAAVAAPVAAPVKTQVTPAKTTTSAPATPATPDKKEAKPEAAKSVAPAVEQSPEPEAKSIITAPKQPVVPAQDITTATVKSAWPMILETLAKQSRSAWAVAFTTKVIDFKDEVLTLLFQSQNDVDAFKSSQGASEVLRQVIREQLGVVVKYRAKVAEAPVKPETKNTVEPTAPEEFTTEEEIEAQDAPVEVIQASEPEAEQAGEFVLREVLGAKPIKGEPN
ncbi:DNA polymerase III subunit gamma and tau [Candidatus Aquiluna sp. IMCC13023]|uniref:DNA polymerase III subunit gamma and tau n=1 Tax=Candidatus Aquiluna sp. IMCC13023 TaxID=1081644 RepID=UPI0002D3A924|nr:DNA polymerase III subunit gamma and tau [Candidatus Aquiluna sp. IMCC13023]